MAEGEILEEGEGAIRVIPETLAEEEAVPGGIHQAMINYPANNQLSSKGTDESQKVSCRNGTYITVSIDTPLK